MNNKTILINMQGIHIPVLKIVGLGGGGCNAIERMMEFNLSRVEFIAANTDQQVLKKNSAPTKIQLGLKSTRGLGAGGDPGIGRIAAEESQEEIASALSGADMVFLTAGMGGGTGTGAIPVVAQIAREQGAAVIAIVTTPFSFEMGKRQRNAREGLEALRKHTHTLLSIPNDRLLYVAPRNLPMEVAFRLADDVLRQAVQGIAELVYEPGLINVDYAHIERMIRMGGGAYMSIGQGTGSKKLKQAVDQALHHPLLEDINLENAAGIIANFTGGEDLTLFEVDEALRQLQNQTGSQTEIIMGVTSDNEMDNRVQVILMVTGIGAPTLEETLLGVQKPVRNEETLEKAVEIQTPFSNYYSDPILGSHEETPKEPGIEIAPSRHNLDIPAFLRKRSRVAVSS
jgi:cell division protein FtsZ